VPVCDPPCWAQHKVASAHKSATTPKFLAANFMKELSPVNGASDGESKLTSLTSLLAILTTRPVARNDQALFLHGFTKPW
jgi:hypothetical protein